MGLIPRHRSCINCGMSDRIRRLVFSVCRRLSAHSSLIPSQPRDSRAFNLDSASGSRLICVQPGFLSFLLVFVALWCGSSFGATYYVSTTGSDANPGTQSAPWLTMIKAGTVVVAGDTVLVQPGVYTTATTYFSTKNSGTPSAPITFRALGPVTNNFGFYLNKSHIVLDGFSVSTQPAYRSSAWYLGRGIYMDRTATYNSVSNCSFYSRTVAVREPTAGGGPEQAAKYFRFHNNLITTITNGTMLTLMGVGHDIRGNVLANGYSADAFRLFGSNVVICANLITNIGLLEGIGNHPDIMQTFGDNGYWMVDYVFERNRVVDCPVQLMQFVMTQVREPGRWGMVVRNNVFENSNMQASISIPNVKFHNNTFYKCSNGTSILLSFSFYDSDPMMDSTYRGQAYNGAAVNNAFIECEGAYGATYQPFKLAYMTAAAAGGGGRRGDGKAYLGTSSGSLWVKGYYTNLSGSVLGGWVTAGSSEIKLYNIPATSFSNGKFAKSGITLVDGAGGLSLNAQYGYINSGNLGFRIETSNFPNGEVSGASENWRPEPPSDVNANSDYNFVSLPGGGSRSGWSEPNGINGGTREQVGYYPGQPSMTGLTQTSILRGRGAFVAGVNVDFYGNPRPNPPSIGAFEPLALGERPTAPAGLRLLGSVP